MSSIFSIFVRGSLPAIILLAGACATTRVANDESNDPNVSPPQAQPADSEPSPRKDILVSGVNVVFFAADGKSQGVIPVLQAFENAKVPIAQVYATGLSVAYSYVWSHARNGNELQWRLYRLKADELSKGKPESFDAAMFGFSQSDQPTKTAITVFGRRRDGGESINVTNPELKQISDYFRNHSAESVDVMLRDIEQRLVHNELPIFFVDFLGQNEIREIDGKSVYVNFDLISQGQVSFERNPDFLAKVRQLMDKRIRLARGRFP